MNLSVSKFIHVEIYKKEHLDRSQPLQTKEYESNQQNKFIMKKLKIKKVIAKPIQLAEKKSDKKYFSDMGIGFRVVEMNTDQLLNA